MTKPRGGLAAARATGADTQDTVLSRLASDLENARRDAADAADRFAALCRAGSSPPQIERAAAAVYLSAGLVLALSRRLSS